MLTALSRVTYHTKRSRSETWREFFFARWDVALRDVHHHKIALPAEYEGFLLINGLQLNEAETRALLNFTRWYTRSASIKDWLGKNETKLAASELGADKKKTSSVLLTEMDYDGDWEWSDGLDQQISALETFLADLQPDPENGRSCARSWPFGSPWRKRRNGSSLGGMWLPGKEPQGQGEEFWFCQTRTVSSFHPGDPSTRLDATIVGPLDIGARKAETDEAIFIGLIETPSEPDVTRCRGSRFCTAADM